MVVVGSTAVSFDPLAGPSRDDEPSRFGGITGLFGGMGGGTPLPIGGLVDFLLLALIVAIFVACCGSTVFCDIDGVLCIFRGPGLVVAKPLLLLLLLALSSVDELARSC